jgi:GH25 family lysozyme M1 (1,4-beta-N-acetylmuramidase)
VILTPTAHFADVSHWDADGMDLHLYATQSPLIVLKATEGHAYTDPTFAPVAARVRSVPGLALGAYVFEDAAPEGNQVNHYLSTAHLQPGDAQPIVDAEQLGLTAAETFAALEDLEHRGYDPILYASLAFWRDVLGSPTRWRLWLADYCAEMPELPADVTVFGWQHSQSATCPGIPHPCDMSYLFAPGGDISAFLIP